MRKVIYGLGLVALCLILAGTAAIFVAVENGTRFDSESKAFVDSAVPAIAQNWDEQALTRRASAQFFTRTTPDQIRTAFQQFSTLGHMVRYEGSRGDANMAYFSGTGSSVTASYVANARFENGDAAFQLNLVRQDGRWLIRSIHVTPEGPVRFGSART